METRLLEDDNIVRKRVLAGDVAAFRGRRRDDSLSGDTSLGGRGNHRIGNGCGNALVLLLRDEVACLAGNEGHDGGARPREERVARTSGHRGINSGLSVGEEGGVPLGLVELLIQTVFEEVQLVGGHGQCDESGARHIVDSISHGNLRRNKAPGGVRVLLHFDGRREQNAHEGAGHRNASGAEVAFGILVANLHAAIDCRRGVVGMALEIDNDVQKPLARLSRKVLATKSGASEIAGGSCRGRRANSTSEWDVILNAVLEWGKVNTSVLVGKLAAHDNKVAVVPRNLFGAIAGDIDIEFVAFGHSNFHPNVQCEPKNIKAGAEVGGGARNANSDTLQRHCLLFDLI